MDSFAKHLLRAKYPLSHLLSLELGCDFSDIVEGEGWAEEGKYVECIERVAAEREGILLRSVCPGWRGLKARIGEGVVDKGRLEGFVGSLLRLVGKDKSEEIPEVRRLLAEAEGMLVENEGVGMKVGKVFAGLALHQNKNVRRLWKSKGGGGAEGLKSLYSEFISKFGKSLPGEAEEGSEEGLKAFSERQCRRVGAFLSAVESGDVEGSVKLGRNRPWLVNRVYASRGNQSALHVAAGRGDKAMVSALLGLGGQLDVRDGSGAPPLLSAVDGDWPETVKLLLEAGADPTAIDSRGGTALYRAAVFGSSELIALLLPLSDINAKSSVGRTALMKAAYNNRPQTVSVLLGHPQLDISAGDKNGRTALHMACWGSAGSKNQVSPRFECPESARLLLKAAAPPRARDHRGWTPLLAACATGAVGILEVWTQAGRPPEDFADLANDGASALDLAASYGHTSVARWLIKEGLMPPPGPRLLEFAALSADPEAFLFFLKLAGPSPKVDWALGSAPLKSLMKQMSPSQAAEVREALCLPPPSLPPPRPMIDQTWPEFPGRRWQVRVLSRGPPPPRPPSATIDWLSAAEAVTAESRRRGGASSWARDLPGGRLIDSAGGLAELGVALAAGGRAPVGLDLEFGEHSISLIQIACGGECYLIDAYSLHRELRSWLRGFFTDRAILVFSPRADFHRLLDFFGVRMRGFVDLQVFFSLVSGEPAPGLAAAAASILGLKLDKRLQCAPWNLRPLPPEMARYAALDAAVLPPLFAGLLERGGPGVCIANLAKQSEMPYDKVEAVSAVEEIELY